MSLASSLRHSAYAGMLLSLALFSARAAAIDVTPSGDLRGAIAALKPGDELVLGGGTYTLSSRFGVTVVGTQQQPIVIRAKTGEKPRIHMNTNQQNIIEVQNSRYVTFRGLEFTGGSHGIRLMSSSFVTIENCEVHETGDVAISANSGGTYEGLRILRNHIHHTNGTGEGMYLGCNNDACRIANSLIEGNYIHNTDSADVEQGDGIEIKEGSYGNTVRDNVIHDTNYPGIITYSTVGNGPPNILEGNVIWNSGDNAIQSAADAIIRNNIVLGVGGVAVASGRQPGQYADRSQHDHQQRRGPRGAQRRRPGAHRQQRHLLREQQCHPLVSGSLNLVTVAGNVGHGGLSGGSSGYTEGKGIAADFVAAHYGVPPIDVFPKSGSALIGAGERGACDGARFQRHFAHRHQRRGRLSVQRLRQPRLDDHRRLQDERQRRPPESADQRHCRVTRPR